MGNATMLILAIVVLVLVSNRTNITIVRVKDVNASFTRE